MKRVLLIVWLSVLLYHSSCMGQSKDARPQPGRLRADSVTSAVFGNGDGSYGYDVFMGSKKIIHQPTIPALSGHQGFTTKQDAEKVARLVAGKVKRGIMPPTVTRKEMEQLGIRLPRDEAEKGTLN